MRWFALAVVALGFALSACGGGDGESLEFELALIDQGGEELAGEFLRNDPNLPRILAEYETLLDSLEMKCTEGRRGIADMAIDASQAGGSPTVRVMEGVIELIPWDTGEQPCDDVFTMYVEVR